MLFACFMPPLVVTLDLFEASKTNPRCCLWCPTGDSLEIPWGKARSFYTKHIYFKILIRNLFVL